MPVGVTVNCLAVLTGGILGGWLGRYIPIKTTERMMGVLGLCSFSIGVLKSYESRVSTSCDFGGAAGILFGRFG